MTTPVALKGKVTIKLTLEGEIVTFCNLFTVSEEYNTFWTPVLINIIFFETIRR